MKIRKRIIIRMFLALLLLILSTGCNNSNKLSSNNQSELQINSTSNSVDEGSSNGSQSIKQWIEDRLTPGGNKNEEKQKTKSWVGWVFDRDCIGINPVKHTRVCNIMGSCYASGLGIIPYVEGKSFDTYTASKDFVVFDGKSSIIVRDFIKSLPADWKDNITIKVTGYPVNNIPTNADESHVPENDASKVDHTLSGIHIIRIEAAYIKGLSTNKLPTPNVIYPKP